jgi:L-isoleucine 31-dioxygenase
MEKIRLVEDHQEINFETIYELLNQKESKNCAYIIRDYLKFGECISLKEEYTKIINETNGGNRANDFVPVNQIGATQFTKSTPEYFNECSRTKDQIMQIIDSINDHSLKDDFLLEKSLKDELYKYGVDFAPSSFNDQYVNQFTIRQWINSNDKGLALLPHEDLSQLNFAKLDSYEIGNVKKVIACNLCISNSKGGELLIWDADPDLETKIKLGVENSGYPYPLELLEDTDCISIKINPGDLYFINANLIHAVKEIQGNERITLGRFMGFCADNKVVYWT